MSYEILCNTLVYSEKDLQQLKNKYEKLLAFTKSCLQHSCCLCAPNECLACNAKHALEEIGE